MKVAVVQHALRPAPAQDLEALMLVIARAAGVGAQIIFLPDLPAVYDGPLADELFRRAGEVAPQTRLVTAHGPCDTPGPHILEAVGALGPTAALAGDCALDAGVLERCVLARVGVLALAPGAESDLQAQAVLELAIALSTSAASLVVLAETDGAELGEPGHGGSAIIHLGQVLAEAVAGDDLLVAEVASPLGPPEAPAALPAIPPVLLQRLAVHHGRRLDVDYPADLD